MDRIKKYWYNSRVIVYNEPGISISFTNMSHEYCAPFSLLHRAVSDNEITQEDIVRAVEENDVRISVS